MKVYGVNVYFLRYNAISTNAYDIKEMSVEEKMDFVKTYGDPDKVYELDEFFYHLNTADIFDVEIDGYYWIAV